MNRPILHNYFRSSTSYRVRIALALKGIDYDYQAFHLRQGEQRSERFLKLNPQGLVPALTWTDGRVYTQSLAIIEFLDEMVPEPALLPQDATGRHRVRSLSQMIALDIHPINNLRVLAYLKDHLGADEEAQAAWFRHWVAEAFGPLEQRLTNEPETGRYCHGDHVTMADICLAPQLTNNKRFEVNMDSYPTIRRIGSALAELEEFRQTAPGNQPDNEGG
ncbi:Maleylpyruvate isomerase [Agrobacterium sp. DSM 25558]|uniref:maleylacetoacetate isomerase n=1 Tax=Agrobacterium sp. DSM 25558 TaxID=1907665 RepID=UPI0009726582|nr:maleylacetoacetate isomerase [Agrobacterium sp. DSM 25558]SCX22580.1 Maleylpyruvate isomerase [Agrobacterium sp. DSM 25558]